MMTWSERVKSAWRTFTRAALPLYAWSLIFLVGSCILLIAAIFALIVRLRLTPPQAFPGFLSSGMPIPGVPPAQDINPLTGGFGAFYQNLLGTFDGRFTDSSMLLYFIVSLIITVLLILIGVWLIGSIYYAGLFNLTEKAYHEKVTFGDFRLAGFARIFGWQGILLLIKLAVIIIGVLGIIYLQHSPFLLAAFIIIYILFLIVIGLYLLPWLAVSSIYLLAHRREGFWLSFKGSWAFFQRHMGALWGYVGTVILIEIAIQIINRLSHLAGGLCILAASPFIAVLAVVWVLTLEDEDRAYFDSELNTPNLTAEEPKISLQKDEILPPTDDEKP